MKIRIVTKFIHGEYRDEMPLNFEYIWNFIDIKSTFHRST